MILFADANCAIGPWVTSGGAVIVAIIAGGVAMRTNGKTDRNAVVIQDVKSGVDRDLERLKAKLEHGQLISSTQWAAEFNAYRRLWKSTVPMRAYATKLVNLEDELAAVGLTKSEFSEDEIRKAITGVLQNYAASLTKCVKIINEHAPFYPADIRQSANKMHSLANRIHNAHTAALVLRQKGQSLSPDQSKTAKTAQLQDLLTLAESMDQVEELIRKRLTSVEVVNLVTA
jgi:hypothetical protein